MTDSALIVAKLWNYANVSNDDVLRNIHNLEKLRQSILKQVFEDKLFSKDLYDGTGEELL